MDEENKFPSLEANTLKKPVWFLVRLRSDIEVVVQDNINFKRLTESLITVQFDNITEANSYFEVLNESDLEYSIIMDYSRV